LECLVKRTSDKLDPEDLELNSEGDEGEGDSDRRQKRLVKNREAAALFRKRQKEYIQDLEKKVNDLQKENVDYRTKVDLLYSENKLIKDQLIYLRNVISQAISLQFSPNPPTNEQAIALMNSNNLILPHPILQGIATNGLMTPQLMNSFNSSNSVNTNATLSQHEKS